MSYLVPTDGAGVLESQVYDNPNGEKEQWVNDHDGIPDLLAIGLGKAWYFEQTDVSGTKTLSQEMSTTQSIKVSGPGLYLVVRTTGL